MYFLGNEEVVANSRPAVDGTVGSESHSGTRRPEQPLLGLLPLGHL